MTDLILSGKPEDIKRAVIDVPIGTPVYRMDADGAMVQVASTDEPPKLTAWVETWQVTVHLSTNIEDRRYGEAVYVCKGEFIHVRPFDSFEPGYVPRHEPDITQSTAFDHLSNPHGFLG